MPCHFDAADYSIFAACAADAMLILHCCRPPAIRHCRRQLTPAPAPAAICSLFSLMRDIDAALTPFRCLIFATAAIRHCAFAMTLPPPCALMPPLRHAAPRTLLLAAAFLLRRCLLFHFELPTRHFADLPPRPPYFHFRRASDAAAFADFIFQPLLRCRRRRLRFIRLRFRY